MLAVIKYVMIHNVFQYYMGIQRCLVQNLTHTVQEVQFIPCNKLLI